MSLCFSFETILVCEETYYFITTYVFAIQEKYGKRRILMEKENIDIKRSYKFLFF